VGGFDGGKCEGKGGRRGWGGGGGRYLAFTLTSRSACFFSRAAFASVRFLSFSSCSPLARVSSVIWAWTVLTLAERESRMWASW